MSSELGPSEMQRRSHLQPEFLSGVISRVAREVAMTRSNRRTFLQLGATGLAAALTAPSAFTQSNATQEKRRRYNFVQIDVFSSQPLQGNPLAVFTDARGLSDTEMQDLARETNLQETTFIFPRDRAGEEKYGVKVRIFIPTQEIPFGGHPTLGTAMVLRNRNAAGRAAETPGTATDQVISLDLKVGKIPVTFHKDSPGQFFGEMHQVDPVFGKVHDRTEVAALLRVKPEDISKEWPTQTVSTGLPFAIVPIKRLSTLQALRPDLESIGTYFQREPVLTDFYYICQETDDPKVGLRARAIFPDGEDPATGSAAGCAAAWMVRYGIAKSGETVHIRQGVEIKRPSQIFVRASRRDDRIAEVRVGGHAVEIMEGEFAL
jgi:trans-2,3-dihydro-3-hydroxyanthranilate isomerase